ncbi:maleate cis-trans isomerase family protein [Puniceibacterium confluentis]|uniref:maleate cis-trans isomerase family protein n=1 Tax=Puniceibacterium confluentis TaxID=1958944 RepID=UPI0011B7EC99|nr:aspartate/glutamate racemase family protein [Puniceibacterium confluentis]
MTDFPYDTLAADELRIGLIVLQADESLERDLRQLIPAQVNLLVSRVPSGDEVTPDTLRQMAQDLPAAARLLPQAQRYAVVGYGCTSGAAVIGPAVVAKLIRAAAPTPRVTNPVTALVAACTTMGLRRLAILSPYVAGVSDRLRDVLRCNGIDTPVFGSFNEAREDRVVRIAPGSIMAAAEALAQQGGVDGVFLSCTNLRTLELIAALEARTGLPVLSSNQALGWHMLRQAGVDTRLQGYGRLFAEC